MGVFSMNVTVYDTNLNAVAIVDVFESFVWTDRYCGYGEFELYTNVTEYLLSILQEDYYLGIPNSNRIMIIEATNIIYKSEIGYRLAVSGRSWESVLDRRIVLGQKLVDANMQVTILALLTENFITTSQTERNIPNFIWADSSDPLVTAPTVKAQYDCDDIYEVIKGLCSYNNLGFKIVLNSSNQFVFSMYAGIDRSYTQSTNPYVVFSPEFDNLINSNYLRSKRFYKNYTLILSQAVAGSTRPRNPWWAGDQPTGLQRRELYTDAGDLSRYDQSTGNLIDFTAYTSQAVRRGIQNMNEHGIITQFDALADTTRNFVYGTHFFLGDIVQMEDDFGHASRARVTEITFSENLGGSGVYPTFETL